MMTLRTVAIAATALALALPGAALANGHGHQGHANHADKAQAAPVKTAKKARASVRAKACPPGLAKKNPGCLPPGQWRKGDRLPDSWVSQYVRYHDLPDYYRDHHPFNQNYRYLFRDNRVIVVNAATLVIVNIILR